MAVCYFTKVVRDRAGQTPWHDLQERLRKSPYSPYEFCFFAAHPTGTAEWQRLLWTTYMCSESLWQRFLAWKQDRLEYVRGIVRQQNQSLQCYLDNGLSADDLLTGTRLDMNALVRLENALRLRQEDRLGETLLLDLIRRFTDPATELAIGNPEYLHFTPWFRHWALQLEGDQWTALQWQIRRIERTMTP
jgi:hypothetical protein